MRLRYATFLGILSFSIGLSQKGFSKSFASMGDLKTRFDKIIEKSAISPSKLSLWVSVKKNGDSETVYSLNQDQSFTPASLTKIVTGGAALHALGPTHQFVTQILGGTPADHGVLKGAIYLKGGGDPGFVSESLWNLVNEFYRSGIRRVEGDIVVDATRFSPTDGGSDKDTIRVDRAYDAPTSSMSFNWNSINVFVRPGKAADNPVQVFLDPDCGYADLVVKAKTQKSGRTSLQVTRSIKNGKDLITVSGSMPLNSSEMVYYKNVSQPEVWSAINLKYFLSQRGIEVTGRIRVDATPASQIVLAQTKSKPLHLLVADMMKFSNNFVAEMLTKNLAVEIAQKNPGSMADGIKVIEGFLNIIGIEKIHYVFENPSGLSQKNKFRVKDFALILDYLHNHFAIYPEFVSSLPISGFDGTLKSRLTDDDSRGRIRAKTGMLAGVAGLGGFAERSDHSVATFVFMSNNVDVGQSRKLFDTLASEMIR